MPTLFSSLRKNPEPEFRVKIFSVGPASLQPALRKSAGEKKNSGTPVKSVTFRDIVEEFQNPKNQEKKSGEGDPGVSGNILQVSPGALESRKVSLFTFHQYRNPEVQKKSSGIPKIPDTRKSPKTLGYRRPGKKTPEEDSDLDVFCSDKEGEGREREEKGVQAEEEEEENKVTKGKAKGQGRVKRGRDEGEDEGKSKRHKGDEEEAGEKSDRKEKGKEVVTAKDKRKEREDKRDEGEEGSGEQAEEEDEADEVVYLGETKGKGRGRGSGRGGRGRARGGGRGRSRGRGRGGRGRGRGSNTPSEAAGREKADKEVEEEERKEGEEKGEEGEETEREMETVVHWSCRAREIPKYSFLTDKGKQAWNLIW
jgi:hypothetical protein